MPGPVQGRGGDLQHDPAVGGALPGEVPGGPGALLPGGHQGDGGGEPRPEARRQSALLPGRHLRGAATGLCGAPDHPAQAHQDRQGGRLRGAQGLPGHGESLGIHEGPGRLAGGGTIQP